MGETKTLMRRFIAMLEPDKVFTTRECLPFGKRAAIDQTLCRLVKRNAIVRLARGVFTKSSTRHKPSLEEIASAKAKAFGRRFGAVGSKLAQEFGLIKPQQPQQQPDEKAVFSINSSSSTFKCGDVTIYLRKTCPRKVVLQESQAGKALVALWHMGKYLCCAEQVRKAIAELGRVDTQRLRESAPWLPAWLSAYFLDFPLNHLNRLLITD